MPTPPPPPPLSIQEQIAQEILVVLGGLTTTAGKGGTKLASVERWKKDGNVPSPLKAVFFEGEKQAAGDDQTPEGFSAWHWLVQVGVFFASPEGSSTAYGQTANTIAADVHNVMMAEILNSTNFNDLVQNLWSFGDASGIYNEMPLVWLNFIVEFRHRQYDAYSM